LIDRYVCQPTYGEGAGFVLASPSSRIRLSHEQWNRFSGQLGHQHAPAPNDHWDPGALNLHRIGSYARIELEEDDMFTDDDRALLQQVRAAIFEGAGGGPIGQRVREIHEGQRAVVAKGGVGLSAGDIDKIA